MLTIPDAPKSIQKGYELKQVLGEPAIVCLSNNIASVYPEFNQSGFQKKALDNLAPLSLSDRGKQIGEALSEFLPQKYEDAISVLLDSLTPANTETEGLGLAVLFYQPHSHFVATYGLDPAYNDGEDPFDISMKAQYELTMRNTSEFSIRHFLIHQQERTLATLMQWLDDPNPHVRRLCTEGTRPRLPWAQKIPAFVDDPTPILDILEALKNDPSLYVRRSVANHLGDIAKDHVDLVFEICEKWLNDANKELKWVIRHALRYPAKKGNASALELRASAK